MQPTTASPAITTPHVAASRAFYIKHFGARLVFDCGWFISLEFAPGLSLQFMEPQPEQPACNPTGLTYNFRVADVDETYNELLATGLTPTLRPRITLGATAALRCAIRTESCSTSIPTGNPRRSFARLSRRG